MSASLVGSEMCIRDSHNSAQCRNPRGNMGPFREAFGKGRRGRRHPAPGEWEPPGGFKQSRR
eukprot:6326978-Alexandrium_andersonii.AAC.1